MCVLQIEITGFYESLDFKILEFVRGVEVLKTMWPLLMEIHILDKRDVAKVQNGEYWLHFFFWLDFFFFRSEWIFSCTACKRFLRVQESVFFARTQPNRCYVIGKSSTF